MGLQKFPSPLEASYFPNEEEKMKKREMQLFPSPLEASYFPNLRWKQSQKSMQRCISVPSRGILFSKYYGLLSMMMFVKFFRPLSRHLIFQISYIDVRQHGQYFFRPLSRHLIFQILPARARYFAGFSDSFAWQIIFLYIFLISNIHNRLQMQYLCGARKNYKLYQYYLNSNFTF